MNLDLNKSEEMLKIGTNVTFISNYINPSKARVIID